MTQSKEKTSISAKISAQMKEEIVKEAATAGKTTSEYVAAILEGRNDDDTEKLQLEKEELQAQLREKDILVGKVTDRLEEAQKLLSQQQQLQLMVQSQLESMQKSQQLLLEESTRKARWWQLWQKK